MGHGTEIKIYVFVHFYLSNSFIKLAYIFQELNFAAI